MAGGIIRLDEGWRLDDGHHFDQSPHGSTNPYVVPIKPRKKKNMAGDFIPRKRAERYLWWKNLHDKLDVEGPKIGLTATEITDTKALAAEMIDAMEAVDAADTALKGARAAEKAAEVTDGAAIRLAIRYWKTRPAYASSGVEGTLQLVGTGSDFDPNTFKPTLKLSIVGGVIKLDFTKGECDSVAVRCRLRGSPGWNKLGLDSLTPYYDTAPLADPAVPETREYYVIGVIDDIEVGQPSDVVSIVFGG
ncbi:MAG: hypothetical protein KDK97_22935 [Verrucomicrobiales bacterium]|nr:hypothetical protein [Verrucomicrobiales bacterium]MCP5557738.1 hypothetical protein [Verrucomicrobiaceae bacterium]